MKLESQVVSLELSKKLKELGVKQESLFYWIFNNEKWGLTQLKIGEGGSEYEWLKSRGSSLTPKQEDKVGIGVGIYWALKKETFKRLKITKEEYDNLMTSSYSAFTVAELGNILPDKVFPENQFDAYFLKDMKNTSDGEWIVSYESAGIRWSAVVGDTEADARAKMLIYLIEKKLLTPRKGEEK